MAERINLTELSADELEQVRHNNFTVVKEKAQPQAPYGQQQEVPQERKPEVMKRHIKQTGKR